MPDQLTPDGLTVKTFREIEEQLILGLKEVYGGDMNIGPDTPDGHMVRLFAQAAVDHRELVKKLYHSFDVTQAEGRILDQRVALAGLKRKGASYTFADVQVEVDREVRLQGLERKKGDLTPSVPNLFTVKDNSGTEYYLMDSATIKPSPLDSLPVEKVTDKEAADQAIKASEQDIINQLSSLSAREVDLEGLNPEEQTDETRAELALNKQTQIELNSKLAYFGLSILDIEAKIAEVEKAIATKQAEIAVLESQISAEEDNPARTNLQQPLSLSDHEQDLARLNRDFSHLNEVLQLLLASETVGEWELRKAETQKIYNKKYAEYVDQVRDLVSRPGWFQSVTTQGGGGEEFKLPDPIRVPRILSAYASPNSPKDSSPANGSAPNIPATPIGRRTLRFRASPIGRVETLAGTINTAVTIIGGVTQINNYNKAPITGQDEETDAQIRLRFSRSFALPAQGNIESIESQIAALPQVDQVRVYENFTDIIDSDKQTPHSIWVVIKGAPESSKVALSDDQKARRRSDIAQIFYSCKPAGTGIFSLAAEDVGLPEDSGFQQTERVYRPNGQFFKASWNTAVDRKLRLQFNAIARNEYASKNTDIATTILSEDNVLKLKQSLLGEDQKGSLQWTLGEKASPGNVYSFVNDKHPEYSIFDVKLSLEGEEFNSRSPITPKKYETLVLTEENIIINPIGSTEEGGTDDE